MNIYALNGHKVKCKTFNAGYDHDKETAKKYLKLWSDYEVERTEVGNWYTDVYLKQFPGVRFNSVFFEDAEIQDEEKDKLHPSFGYYN